MSKPRLLLLISEDWFFLSHRLPLALAAQRAGYEVTVVTRISQHGETIRALGLNLIDFPLNRRGLNPFREALTVWRIWRIYRRVRPDVVHQVALKPVLYGSFAARAAGVPKMVNAVAGLGWVFIARNGIATLLAPLIRFALARALNWGTTIVQNPDDQHFLSRAGVRPERIRLIRGAGVDVAAFAPSPEPAGVPLVMLASRLLWDKGVGEFVAAARQLRGEGVAARFVLVGDPDPENRASVGAADLAQWQAEGVVECWGHRSDMAATLAQAHIVCLPSYREGLPKVLLEAAACRRALITTDAPGCREVVRDGDNGLLVPVRDAAALATAIRRLVTEPALRQAMALRSRQRAEEEFSVDKVVAATLAIYAAPA